MFPESLLMIFSTVKPVLVKKNRLIEHLVFVLGQNKVFFCFYLFE